MDVENRTIGTRISSDMQAIARNNMAQLRSIPVFSNVPQPLAVLRFNRSMRNRFRLRHGPIAYTHVLPSLRQWMAAPPQRLLLAQARRDPKSARWFATDMIDLLQQSNVPVLWALPGAGFQVRGTSMSDILRSIAFQATQIDRTNSTTGGYEPVSAAEVASIKTDYEWLLVIKRALAGLSRAYVVIDADLVEHERYGSQRRALESMARLVELCNHAPRLKIILIARSFPINVDESESDEEDGPIRIYMDDFSQRNLGPRDAPQRGRTNTVRGRGLLRAKRIMLALRSAVMPDAPQPDTAKSSDEHLY